MSNYNEIGKHQLLTILEFEGQVQKAVRSDQQFQNNVHLKFGFSYNL